MSNQNSHNSDCNTRDEIIFQRLSNFLWVRSTQILILSFHRDSTKLISNGLYNLPASATSKKKRLTNRCTKNWLSPDLSIFSLSIFGLLNISQNKMYPVKNAGWMRFESQTRRINVIVTLTVNYEAKVMNKAHAVSYKYTCIHG